MGTPACRPLLSHRASACPCLLKRMSHWSALAFLGWLLVACCAFSSSVSDYLTTFSGPMWVQRDTIYRTTFSSHRASRMNRRACRSTADNIVYKGVFGFTSPSAVLQDLRTFAKGNKINVAHYMSSSGLQVDLYWLLLSYYSMVKGSSQEIPTSRATSPRLRSFRRFLWFWDKHLGETYPLFVCCL